MKKNAMLLPTEVFKDLPYDPSAPIKKGATVYKVNSNAGAIYKDGTPGITRSALKNNKGGYNYLVEFKGVHVFENAPVQVLGMFAEVDDSYLSESKPHNTL